MAKKRKFEKRITDQQKYMNQLKYKDLKRECIIRGMDFDEVLAGDISVLWGWLRKHFYEDPNHSLLDKFDDYQEEKIKEAVAKKGEDGSDIIHPSLRLGYIAEVGEDGNVTKRRRVKTLVKKKKKRRERTEDGVFKGTKKAYTFELQKEGLDKKEVIAKVIEKFPDASEKSVGIWFNKAKKLRK